MANGRMLDTPRTGPARGVCGVIGLLKVLNNMAPPNQAPRASQVVEGYHKRQPRANTRGVGVLEGVVGRLVREYPPRGPMRESERRDNWGPIVSYIHIPGGVDVSWAQLPM